MAIDIDYVDDVIWPSLTLSDYYDTPQKMKDQKIDPYSVFATAGVKLIYDPRESDKVKKFSFVCCRQKEVEYFYRV